MEYYYLRPTLEDCLNDDYSLLPTGHENIVVDLSGIETIKSSFLSILVCLVTQENKKVYILNCSNRIRQIINVMSLDCLFIFIDSLKNFE